MSLKKYSVHNEASFELVYNIRSIVSLKSPFNDLWHPLGGGLKVGLLSRSLYNRVVQHTSNADVIIAEIVRTPQDCELMPVIIHVLQAAGSKG